MPTSAHGHFSVVAAQPASRRTAAVRGYRERRLVKPSDIILWGCPCLACGGVRLTSRPVVQGNVPASGYLLSHRPLQTKFSQIGHACNTFATMAFTWLRQGRHQEDPAPHAPLDDTNTAPVRVSCN